MWWESFYFFLCEELGKESGHLTFLRVGKLAIDFSSMIHLTIPCD